MGDEMTYIKDKNIQAIGSEDFFQKRFRAFRLLLNSIIEIEEAVETDIYTILGKNLRKICNANYVAITSYS